MGLRINNNIAALNSYNNVNRTDKAVSSSLEKLSSGYRINKAADDAAGLVISEGLRSQIGGLTVASRNAQDGVNVVQTADGALGTVGNILQRMRDLAVQASNSGTADTAAKTAAQTEFNSLRTEITRISDSTKFGGQKLLDGSYGVKPAVLTGVDADNAITVAASSAFTINVAGTGAVTVNPAAGTYTGATYAAALESAIKSALAAGTTAQQAYASKISVSSTTVGSGAAITLTAQVPSGQSVVLADGANTPLAVGSMTGTPVAASGSGGRFQIGANQNDTVDVSIGDLDAAGLSINSLDLTVDAESAITAVNTAISSVSAKRAELGAVQNRFEYAISNLATSIENITASESAIRDTDMAAEMTKFTKNQILSQAGTSMLAQANSSTQNILTLLRG